MSATLHCSAFGRSLRTLTVPGFELREALYRPVQEIPRHRHPWAHLCLVVEGGYDQEWGGSRLRVGPASLLFHPPGEAHRDWVSDAGSRCFTIAVEPAVFRTAVDALPRLSGLRTARLGPPSWLAFRLRTELELNDGLVPTSIESAVLALLADFGRHPGLQRRRIPPPWLARVTERIRDEFAEGLTLQALAETAGVHRVHLARAFHDHYGCTVGEYIRLRRVACACHRLLSSGDRVTEIAFDAGFADQSHLTNTFRRLVGMTPAAFRSRFSQHRAPAQR